MSSINRYLGSISRARAAGRRAGDKGLPKSTNPHTPASGVGEAWVEGWYEGTEIRRCEGRGETPSC